MIQEIQKGDYTLIKSRDPGLPSFTFFWMKDNKIVSPYFDDEKDSIEWFENQEKNK